ncbi:uncharacterized protein LOC132202962 [Neocloeon triangulifer]|uniref:uncharacterized protein LOC132202962 n=1 Tax=Neocloeon triangulifer TaxID=2078957 RepID=UPI00286EF590|nr:uncharacterized protein LOC132202962 [Neocloeon triangulifer]
MLNFRVFPKLLLLIGAIILINLCSTEAAGLFYDLSEGNPGLVTPCAVHSLTDAFKLENATNFDPDFTGQVFVSRTFKDMGCLQTPEWVEVHENFSFKALLHLPKPIPIAYPVPIFYSYLWTEQKELIPLAYHMGPVEDSWVRVQHAVPHYIAYPFKAKVEIRSDLFTAEYVAIRWFGLSDEALPPVQPWK